MTRTFDAPSSRRATAVAHPIEPPAPWLGGPTLTVLDKASGRPIRVPADVVAPFMGN